MTTPVTHSKVALAFASLPDRAVPRRCAGAARLRSCRPPSGDLAARLQAIFGPKTRPVGTLMRRILSKSP